MTLTCVFAIGLAIGVLAQRYGFCVFGAFVELFAMRRWEKAVGVLAAMLVFPLVHLIGPTPDTVPVDVFVFVGGVLQGVGYFLASGCTLGLLVRIGEGSKPQFVALVGCVAGILLHQVLIR